MEYWYQYISSVKPVSKVDPRRDGESHQWSLIILNLKTEAFLNTICQPFICRTFIISCELFSPPSPVITNNISKGPPPRKPSQNSRSGESPPLDRPLSPSPLLFTRPPYIALHFQPTMGWMRMRRWTRRWARRWARRWTRRWTGRWTRRKTGKCVPSNEESWR